MADEEKTTAKALVDELMANAQPQAAQEIINLSVNATSASVRLSAAKTILEYNKANPNEGDDPFDKFMKDITTEVPDKPKKSTAKTKKQ